MSQEYLYIFCVAYSVMCELPGGETDTIYDEEEVNLVGTDVEDIVEQLKKDNLNTEINSKTEDGYFHAVCTKINITSVSRIGILDGISTAALKLIAKDRTDIEGLTPDDPTDEVEWTDQQ